jgi:RecQ family ATP-dependent DNA helicase
MPIAKIEEAQFNYRSKNVDLDLFQKGMRNLPRVLRGLGYAGLRPGQDQIVFSLMGGVDTLAVMATAAGKTACFVIPALCLDMRVLIFCPLKSLMRDQVKNLQRQGIVALNISSDNQEAENVRNISDWVRGDCKILYIAPERLNNAQFMAALRQMPPHMIVVDEMHVLSAWSDNFRASYQFIGDVIEMYNPRIVAGLTATLDKETERDVRRVLRVPDAPKIKIRGIRHNLKLTSSDINEHDDLVGRCREAQGSTLVYCGTQKRSEDTAVRLSKSLGEEVGFYHAGVPEKTKQMYQDSFYDGRTRVMCATNAFGMGIDKPDIRAVFHTVYPSGPQALQQEIGRGGRDGLDCMCHTYRSRYALDFNERIIRMGHPAKDLIERFYDALLQRSDASGVSHMSYEEIELLSGVDQDYYMAITQTLRGSRCTEEVDDGVRVHQVKFNCRPQAKQGQKLVTCVQEIAHVTPEGWSCFDLDLLANKMGLVATTVRKYLNDWSKPDPDGSRALDYVPPPRGKPVRLIGGLDLVDYDRLAKKREGAYAGLAYVQKYFDVKDAHKHQYLDDYFAHEED